MAIDDAYATPDEYRARVEHHNADNDPIIDMQLRLMSRVVERELGRFFTQDAVAVARTFFPTIHMAHRSRPLNWAESENPWLYGGYTRELEVDDMAAVPTSIKVDEDGDGLFSDETAFVSTDYLLLPQNADKGPEPRPYTSIYIPDWSTRSGFSEKRVEVTAQWGWPAVPEAIRDYTCQLTAILRLESPRATRSIDEFQRVVGMSQQGMGVLNTMKRAYAKKSARNIL